ncbi:MAG: DUF1846 domain-containing protein [Nanoarchaeota archaeon]|nr:DUF1846 domain-containing protein [Nanoarchaeota archaeon]
MKKGFDSQIYIQSQTAEILKRVRKFDRLYLEFGGKLCYDNHASRVLPGYKTTTKVELLKKLGPLRIIYCINAKDLQSSKVLGKKERSYQDQSLKDLHDIKKFKLSDNIVIITRFENEPKAKEFAKKLKSLGKKVYFHKEIKNYSNPSGAIKGYDNQPYIPIKDNLIIITGPAGGSGKMAVALSQIYHEKKRKRQAAFAKFETFPIWNLPLNHPINLAYEAATADLQDVNMIDPFHKKAYNKRAVNYNRDIKNFSILQAIAKKITKKKFPYGYKSPTDMGVNMAKMGIIDDKICRNAAIKEIKRRHNYYKKEFKRGIESKSTIRQIKKILSKIK